MHPRPIYRWKSLWFGILVLAFLGWAWVRSVGEFSEVSWGSRSSCWMTMFRQGNGVLQVGAGEHIFVAGSIGGFHFSHQKLAPAPQGLRIPFICRECFGPRFLSIQHQFLILLFLIPWAAWLVWRSRRMKRLAATTGSPSPRDGS